MILIFRMKPGISHSAKPIPHAWQPGSLPQISARPHQHCSLASLRLLLLEGDIPCTLNTPENRGASSPSIATDLEESTPV